MKIKRDAFLYLEPGKCFPNFAQCGTCMMFTGKAQTCTIHGKNLKITASMSCGFYINGKPMPEEEGHEMKSVTPEESGLVNRQTRCENCKHFNDKLSVCKLYEELNESLPNLFDLDEYVNYNGCCNAQIPL